VNGTGGPEEIVEAAEAPVTELVVCALDAWDDVWIRNQPLADGLLRRLPALRVLFVEPPTDPIFNLVHLRLPVRPNLRALRGDGRLHALRPLKLLPRRLGSLSDRLLLDQVIYTTRRLGFTRPTLCLNDVTYAPLIRRTRWPAVYDVSDDWLLAPFPPREIARLRRLDELALADANEVVVCSPALAASRGAGRAVTLVPNAVNVERFRRLQPRPRDLPPAPTAVYVGTLHEARLDVGLVIDLARSLTALSVVLVGPDALPTAVRRRLGAEPNVHLLGARPHAEVPGYLQHADVVFVPHLISPFTESLDPVKAYECLAVDTPTVATPVAGFRELAGVLTVAPRALFVDAVHAALSAGVASPRGSSIPTWDDRAREPLQTLPRGIPGRPGRRAPGPVIDG
jgi:teichuronic acid biosynthesis glycosyltransferase TuaH